MADPKSVLVTGSAGGVGTAICAELSRKGHQVVGFDRLPTANLDNSIVGDITDRKAVRDALAGRDAVIHLAATPDEADFLEELLEPNVRGLYNVCDGARQQDVSRLILASSVQVVWGHQWNGLIKLEDGPRVTNHYALTKLWAEDIGEMYARCYGHSVIAVRLGWLPRSQEHANELQASPIGPDLFLSHEDAARFFTACVEADLSESQFEILFATSKAKNRVRIDLSRSEQVVGYQPHDTWPEGISFSV